MSDTLSNAEANILWGRAGGRCCSPTCSRQTDQYDAYRFGNAGERAHILGRKPGAARHDPNQTDDERGSLDNHILLCRICHKMVDDKKLDFPAEVLRKWKEDHESRVARLLDLGLPAVPTVVLRMTARFGPGEGRIVGATNQQVLDAVLSRGRWVPERSQIDLQTDTSRRDDDPSYWVTMRHEIETQFDKHFGKAGSIAIPEHLSVFASGPIPLLVFLGRLLGDTRAIQLYDFHRQEGSWQWPDLTPSPLEVVVSPITGLTRSGEAALAVCISGTPDPVAIRAALGRDGVPLFTVSVPAPGPGLVRAPEHLAELRAAFLRAVQEIREGVGNEGMLHVFPALGLSSAVALGQTFLQKVGPHVRLYDFNKHSGGWVLAFEW